MGVSSMVDQEVCGLHPSGFDPYHTSPFIDDFLGFACRIRHILGLQTKGRGKVASLFTALQIPFDGAIPTVALFLG
jgi:hypothetical protein